MKSINPIHPSNSPDPSCPSVQSIQCGSTQDKQCTIIYGYLSPKAVISKIQIHLVIASQGGKKADLQLLAIELKGHVSEWI